MSFSKIKETVEVLKLFFNTYSSLGDAHMVDYFVKDHWNQLLGDDLKNELMCLTVEKLRILPALAWSSKKSSEETLYNSHFSKILFEDYAAVFHYLNMAKSCRIAFFDIATDITKINKKLKVDCHLSLPFSEAMNIESKEYMCPKKSHEVSAMAPLVNHLCDFLQTDCVLDIGSGKGYLSTFLTLRYNLNVTGIEANEANSINALTRAKKYLNYWTKHLYNKDSHCKKLIQDEKLVKFESVATHITNDTELKVGDSNYVAIGLHACGDLCCHIISLFTNKPNIVGLCAVGCCYHLNTEIHECEKCCFKGKNFYFNLLFTFY